MGIFNYFRSKPKTASIAKERLQVLIAHERSARSGPEYLPMLKQDLLEVIRRYVDIDEDNLNVSLEQQDSCDVLELNVTLSDKVELSS